MPHRIIVPVLYSWCKYAAPLVLVPSILLISMHAKSFLIVLSARILLGRRLKGKSIALELLIALG